MKMLVTIQYKIFLYDIDVENNYTLNKDNPKFVIFTYTLEDDFKNNSIL